MATVVQHEHEHGFAFVSVNNSGKPQPTDRKTIRSHCMRGKNRTIGLGPRAPRRVSPSSTLSSRSRSSLHLSEGLAEGSSGSTFGFEVSGPESYSRSPALVNSSIPGLGNKDCHDETGINLQLSQYNSGANQGENENHHAFTQLEQQTLTKIYTPSTLSLLHFAFEVTTDDKAFLFDFLNAFTSTMYPTTAFTAYNIATCPWANWTFTDPSYLQCIFFMACVLRDLSQSQCQYATHPEGKLKSITAPTYGALRNTIMHLNKRLSHPDSSIALADSTIAVVVILTMFCCMMGDHEGAKAHVAGLKMLVFLRGGIQGFGGNEKLIIKLSR
ncbi:uncharacterized protein BDV14DRAFT_198471 [Aspergillus stella-maris]|uniref:uncharacterized protein n=1 Tax=Aspergillus stella-maris TaxID=1810926 RepID=UPI003CCDE60D